MKKYSEYKDSGIEWIGEIPSHWEIWKVSHSFSEIGSGTTPKSGDEKYHENGTISWLNTGDLNDGVLYSCKKKITEDALKDYSALKIFPADSVAIAMYGATIAKTSIIKFDTTANQACCILSRSKIIIDNFLFYWFIANKKEIINLAKGGGQPNISQDTIKELKIPCPLIDEQTDITNYLDRKTAEIDDLIAKKERLIDLYNEERIANINQAVTKGLDPTVPMKDSGIEWLGEIPEHWEVKRLKFIGDAIGGLTYSPNDIVDNSSEGTLVLRSSNIQKGKLSLEDNVFVNVKIPEKILLKKGDILICSRNGSKHLIGKNICIDEQMEGSTFGAFMMIFRSKYWNFLYQYFNSAIFTSQSSLFLTATINQLTSGTINSFIIALPPREEQSDIANYLRKSNEEYDQLLYKIEREIDLLKEYKTALISEVVLGKVDIRKEVLSA